MSSFDMSRPDSTGITASSYHITDTEIPEILKQLAESYLQSFEDDDFQTALIYLKRCEEILEAITT